MRYEIRIWNNANKMPSIAPQKAANMLQNMVDTINAFGGAGNNPDILIDKNAGGEDAIQSVDISYLTKEVDNIVRGQVQGKNKVRVIKMNIKGNLYLPLEEDGLTSAAKGIAGNKGDENKLRNTLLLSKWASVLPEYDAHEHFYRGIIISVITKAGDFRVITAKNVYVDSYTENYKEGEFGTFDLTLLQRPEVRVADFKVDGLGYEKLSTLDRIKNGVEKAAKVTAVAGTVVATAGAVGKTVTETVEKFTGETEATRWIKYGMDTASNTGNIANSAANIAKNPKNLKNVTKETQNMTKEITDNVKKAKDTKHMVIPLDDLEKKYLDFIKRDPKQYEEYLNSDTKDKRKMLEEAAEKMLERAKITKEMEEETRDYYKNENAKEKSAGNSDLNTLISSAAQKKNGDSNGSN